MNYESASALLPSWKADHLANKAPTLFSVGSGAFQRIEIGPGLVSLLGGPPGTGKTALVMQWVTDALRLSPTLRALVCNVEMPPLVLMDRQLSRLSGIPSDVIRHRRINPEMRERFEIGFGTLSGLADRLAFVRFPFSMDNIVKSADSFGADLIVFDYLQRISPPTETGTRKDSVDAVMGCIRAVADHGIAVLAVAAVSRQRNQNGKSGYEELNLASFRESSELEYGADDAFLLSRTNPEDRSAMLLSHVKSRHGETQDLPLRFTGSVQRFDALEAGPLESAIASVWGSQHLVPGDAEGGAW